jgi:glutaredoxin-like protein
MTMLSEDDAADVSDELEAMDEPVTVHLFTPDDCQFCEEAVELNEELVALSEKLALETHDFDSDVADANDVGRYGPEGPVALLSTEDAGDGVRFFGIPSGHEFGGYVADVVALSTGETDIPETVAEQVRDLDDPVDIKVFVTPTCPYCPQAVRTAHDFAIESDAVTAEMIEAQEFTSVSQEFNVRGVPQVNVNGEAAQFTGAQPPQQFLEQVRSALDAGA